MKLICGILIILTSGIACAHELADVGEPCGGFGGLRCKRGLVCEPHPTIIDEFGVCI